MTTNIIHFADLHLNEQNMEQTKPALEQIVQIVKKEKPNYVVFAGDMGVKRGYITPTEDYILKSAFMEMADVPSVTIIAISGNHDITNRYDRVDTVTGILTRSTGKQIHPHIIVRNTIDVIQMNEIVFVTIPHPSKYNLMASGEANGDINVMIADKLKEAMLGLQGHLKQITKPIVVVGHGTIAGGVSDNEMLMTTDIDVTIRKEWLPEAQAYMWGHLHKRQVIGKDTPIVYAGAPAPLTFGQEKHKPSIEKWSIKDGIATHEPIPLRIAHDLQTIEIGADAFKNGEPPMNVLKKLISETDLKDAKIRLRYEIPKEKAGLIQKAELTRWMKERGVFESKIVSQVVDDISIRAESIDSEMSQEALLSLWAGLDAERKPYLTSMHKIATETDVSIPSDELHKLTGTDYEITRLQAKNFKPLIDVDVKFDTLGKTVCISGENHNGKSQLAEAERFALWKIIRRGTSLADVVRHGATDEAKVSVHFNSKGNEYRVERMVNLTSSGRAKGEVVFSVRTDNGYKPLNEGTAIETQKAIERVVGSYAMYRATRFGSQSEIDLLCRMLPSELKDTLQEAINVGVYDIRKAIAQKEADQIAKQNQRKVNEIEVLKGKVEPEQDILNDMNGLQKEKSDIEKDIEHIETTADELKINVERCNQAQEQVNRKIERKMQLEQNLTNEDNTVIRLEKILENKDKVDEGLEKLQTLKREYERADKDFECVFKIIGTYTDKQHALRFDIVDTEKLIRDDKLRVDTLRRDQDLLRTTYDRELRQLNHEAETAKSSGKLVDSVPCAGTDMNSQCDLLTHARQSKSQAEAIEKKIKDLKAPNTTEHDDKINATLQKVEQLTQNIAKANEKIDMLDKECIEEQNKYPLAEKRDGIREALHAEEKKDWDKIKQDLMVAEEKIAQASKYSKHLRDELNTLIAEIRILQEQASGEFTYRHELMSTKQVLTTKIAEKDSILDKIGRATEQLNNIAGWKNRLNEIEDGMIETVKTITAYNLYLQAVSRDGLPFLLLERALPRFEQYANEFLCVDEGFPNALRIQIQSQKELQSGDAKDEVVIKYVDDRGTHPLGEASGWQKVAVGYALRASLAKVQAMATGAEINHCIYDEGWGACDQNNILMGKRMIQKFGEEFGKFFYITHMDTLKEIADTTIHVNAVDGGASIEIV